MARHATSLSFERVPPGSGAPMSPSSNSTETILETHGQQISSLMAAMKDLSVSFQRISSTHTLVINRLNSVERIVRGDVAGVDSISSSEQRVGGHQPLGDASRIRQEFDDLHRKMTDLKLEVRTLAARGYADSPAMLAMKDGEQTPRPVDGFEAPEESLSLISDGRQDGAAQMNSDFRQDSTFQVQWREMWLNQAENGELDIYTCLALSNCFTFTPDTRKILARAIAVTFLQMVVPYCLLIDEFSHGIEVGPAEGGMGFRTVGAILFGYAIYSMFKGAQDQCRTELLNLCFNYDGVSPGHWIPLLIGEVSNVFTAVVLVVALYSIFTTQTQPADLILNAVAVNFLGDVDGSFVDSDMKKDAIATFKTFSHGLFSKQNAKVFNEQTETCTARIVEASLRLVSIAGVIGCLTFLIHPAHYDGVRDTTPGFSHNVYNVNSS